MSRIYIDKYVGKIEREDTYLVRLILKDGTVYEKLEPRRLFPVTNKNMYITLLNSDEKEVGFVRDLEELDDDSKNILLDVFKEYYMIPNITRVVSLVSDTTWTVETDRGPVTFRVQNRYADIKPLRGTNRLLFRDSNDNRYEIPDYTKLDAASQRILFPYV